MPSIWAQVQGAGDDPITNALDAAARQPIGPWNASRPLPLPEVEWALTVRPGELSANQTWPPARFSERQERLALYHDVWRGDLRRLIDARQLSVASVGAANLPRRITKFVADLLIREQPTVGSEDGPGADPELSRLLHTTITMAIKNGVGALLFARTSAGPMMRAIDSRWLYPTAEGGWLIAEPRNVRRDMARAFVPDALQVTSIDAEGTANVMVVGGTPTGVGSDITVGPVTAAVELGEALLLPILALPEAAEGRWGTSWYDDFLSTVVQKARAMARATRVLDGNSDPLLLMRGNLDDYTSVPGVPRSAATGSVSDPQHDAQVARRLRALGPLIAPAGVENAEYVTWDGSLEWNQALLDAIDRDFRLLSGMPAVLDSEREAPSGMSLRRTFWQFDAGVAPLFNGARASMTRGLRFLGLGELEWQNALEALEGTPMGDAREDVEDESTARRGEGNDSE